MADHHWKTIHTPANPIKDPTEVTCESCGTVALQFAGTVRYPLDAACAALFGRYTSETIPRVPDTCEDTTLVKHFTRDPNPTRSPQTWTKAVCRVLGIASERVGIRTREKGMIEIPIVTIDDRPLGVAILDFVRDEPAKSRYGLVGAICDEAKRIDESR